jgi:hypothetical protein
MTIAFEPQTRTFVQKLSLWMSGRATLTQNELIHKLLSALLLRTFILILGSGERSAVCAISCSDKAKHTR